MAYTINQYPDDKYIEIKIYGKLDLVTADKMSSELVNVFIEANCSNALVDLRETNLLFSTVELFYLPKLIERKAKAAGSDITFARRAIILTPNTSQFTFFEELSSKMNQTVKLFNDENEAKQWLLSANSN